MAVGKAGPQLGYVLNLLAIVVFGLFLCFALVRLADIEREMRIEASENMVWVMSQSQREVLRLDAAVARHLAGMATPAGNLDLRYDLLLSRLHLLEQTPQRAALQRLGLAGEIEQATRAVRELEPALRAVKAGVPEAAESFASVLLPLAALFNRAANAAMVQEWNDLGARLDQSRRAVWEIIATVVVILLSGAVLSTRLLLTLRQARRAETSLRQEKQFSELVLGSSGEGIVAVDREGRCTLWNPAMSRIVPVAAGAARGARLAEVAGLFAVERITRAIDAGLAGESGECRNQPYFRDMAAQPRYLDILVSPLRQGSAVVGAILFVRDMTDRYMAERALVRHRDELEQQVAERTTHLRQTQDRLLVALHDLEQAFTREHDAAEFYRGFAAMVSHQFRTPLAIIDSNVQRLVRRGADVTPAEVAQRADRIRASIRRLTDLVESTLNAARLDAGQISVEGAMQDLRTLVAVACERQREAVPERTIRFDPPDAVLPAWCDPALVDSILSNLLGNAVKYSPPHTDIEVAAGTAEGRSWCAVRDHGVGIPAGEIHRIFERFYRASTVGEVRGTGIGLNLAQALAQRQEGEITAQSCEGQGSTFTLWLPAQAPVHPTRPDSQEVSP